MLKDQILKTQFPCCVPQPQPSGKRVVLCARASPRQAAANSPPLPWPPAGRAGGGLRRNPRCCGLPPGGGARGSLPGGGWMWAARPRQVTQTERGLETRRARGNRAPSACGRGAAGAGTGGDRLTTWTLLTCGSGPPRERSRLRRARYVLTLPGDCDPTSLSHAPGPRRHSQPPFSAWRQEVAWSPFHTYVFMEPPLDKWKRGTQFCRLLEQTPCSVGKASGTHLVLFWNTQERLRRPVVGPAAVWPTSGLFSGLPDDLPLSSSLAKLKWGPPPPRFL